MNISTLHTRYKKIYAANVLRFFRVKIQFVQWRMRHGFKLMTLCLLAAALFTVLLTPHLQRMTGDYFSHEDNFAALRSLLGGTGAALIGAAAIAFSLIVFAMQTNVERMPHGLFTQLSSDKRLLSSFLGSFLSAIAVAGMSLIPDGSWGVPAIVAAIWGITLIVLLFLFAYRRALQLINPIEQLAIMSMTAQQDLQRWSRLADNAALLLAELLPSPIVAAGAELPLNTAKAKFYKINFNWNNKARQAIPYAISYAKRFAEQGDYEVTDHAFLHLKLINTAYCEAKHGTFAGSNPLFDIHGTTDGFINTSLEQLRQTMKAALAKGDERLAESTLRAIGGLYEVYLEIDYRGPNKSKHHALIASSYMVSAVKTIIPHNMPDLMMEGIRLMGRASRIALDHTSPTEIISIAQAIATLSYIGAANPSHQPVTLTAFEQLADLTYDLLIKGKHDIHDPILQLRSAVTEAAKMFLNTPDTPLSSMHRSTLGPYFSCTSGSSFRGKFTLLVKQLLGAPVEDAHASEIIDNIETWAEQIYIPQKELLLIAIDKRSSFTFDAIDWVIGVAQMLNELSNAPACSEHAQDKLRTHAVRLVSTLSWLPDERESVIFTQNHNLSEGLFEAALDGYRQNFLAFYEACKELLMGWAKKGGKYETGWGVLETTVEALIALAIEEGTPEAMATLKIKLRQMLASEGAPSLEIRTRAATNLVDNANKLRRASGFWSIDRTLARQDNVTVREALIEMAGIINVEQP